MLPAAFSLQVPADPVYRDLALAVASRLVELMGGGPADRDALVEELTRALTEVAAGGTVIDLAFRTEAASVEITATCGGGSRTVRHEFQSGSA